MSGSAKAGTTAERHTCELRVLIASIVRAPPKRASGESFSPLTKDLHGCRHTGSYPETGFEEVGRIGGSLRACRGLRLDRGLYGNTRHRPRIMAFVGST